MKNILTLVAAACLIVIVVFVARATNFVLLGTLVPVNGTTNTASISLGSVRIPMGSFLIQNGGLASTNELVVNIQISVDNTNFITVATYGPSTTNATTDLFVPNLGAQTVYMRAQAITTNTVNLGGIYQQ